MDGRNSLARGDGQLRNEAILTGEKMIVLCPIETETPAHDGAYCITRTSFLFTNSWMPSSPVSRPYPDFLIPPKGMSSYV